MVYWYCRGCIDGSWWCHRVTIGQYRRYLVPSVVRKQRRAI